MLVLTIVGKTESAGVESDDFFNKLILRKYKTETSEKKSRSCLLYTVPRPQITDSDVIGKVQVVPNNMRALVMIVDD